MMADPILDQVLLFYLGNVWQQASDIGECLDTASRVAPEDEYSWAREWRRTAERLQRTGMASFRSNHWLSAGDAFNRAATYYRAALHRYPEPADPDVRQMARLEVDCFELGLTLSASPARTVRIPYEGTTLPGYLFPSPAGAAPSPMLIVHQGRDAWAEDCRYIAEAAMKRGYHCLLFDGPGQGKTLRLQGLTFRPDWERVITPVVDYAVGLPAVDKDRIALMGISMGGALAPRAAAFEKRLKILVTNPGVLRWSDVVYNFIGAVDPELLPLLESDAAAFNARIEGIMEASNLIRWGVKDTMWKHGATSPADMMIKMKEFTNEDSIHSITCRTLVMDGTADEFSTARDLYDALPGPKDYLLFTEEDAAQTHVQTGALAIATQRLFDWLDDHL
jgi:pimeloyl-ACP methyl ester carboxylesterase